jgi:hypothetical protein
MQVAQKKYDGLHLSLKDEDKLDDIYNLLVLLQKTKRLYFKCDIDNLLIIIMPKDDETIERAMELYTESSNVMIKQIACSILWYCEWRIPTYFKHTNGTHSLFNAGGKNAPTCIWEFDPEYWNGGSKHHVDKCKQPKQQNKN